MALRAELFSPGSGSRFGSSEEPRTTYLISRFGMMRGRVSEGVKIGKPAGVSVLASDSPSSRPPSSRWTVTLSRCVWTPSWARAETVEGESSADCSGEVSVLTSLMTVGAATMLAPASRGSFELKRLVRSAPESLRRPAAVKDPFRTRHALGDALHLGRAGGERRRARVAPRFGHHDAYRDRYERRPQDVAVAFLGFDPSTIPVLRVVKGRHGGVEAPRDLGCDRLGHAGLGQDHEVVATDVTRKMLLRIVLLEDLEDDGGQRLDHVVTAQESVMVVVALERVDVRVQDGEALVLRETPADLTQDVAVAAHAGQRAELTCRGRPGHHRAKSGHQLLGNERLGDVVVGTREQVLDLVLERVAHGQEHDRDQSRAKVLTQLGEDLVAGHVAEHEIQHDDVGPPFDRGLVGGPAVVHGNAFESGSVQDTLDESCDLLVVVDHQHRGAMGRRVGRRGAADASGHAHVPPEAGGAPSGLPDG